MLDKENVYIIWKMYYVQDTEVTIENMLNEYKDDRLFMMETFYEYVENHITLHRYDRIVKLDYATFINTCEIENIDHLLKCRPECVLNTLAMAMVLYSFHLYHRMLKINLQIVGSMPLTSIAQVKSNVMSQFIAVKGTVLRISCVKPLVTKCNFTCLACDTSILKVFQNGKYAPPRICANSGICKSRAFRLERDTATTVDYQTIKYVLHHYFRLLSIFEKQLLSSVY